MKFKNNYNFLKIKEIKSEIKNISWPERKDSFQTVLIVLIFILISMLFFYIIDSILIFVLSKIV